MNEDSIMEVISRRLYAIEDNLSDEINAEYYALRAAGLTHEQASDVMSIANGVHFI